MLRGWLGTKQKPLGSTKSLTALDEAAQIEDAMRAVTHIMNDDVEAADEGLSKGSSSFHLLGKGVVTFLKAALGFEQAVMHEASERLAAAESSAAEHQRRVLRAPHSYHSTIYQPGTEFTLCQAESQLMGAVIAVLNESLTESIRGFYKLRKAYIALESILDAEEAYLKSRSASSVNGGSSRNSIKSRESDAASASASATNPDWSAEKRIVKDPDESGAAAEALIAARRLGKDASNKPRSPGEKDEFFDADEEHKQANTTEHYEGHLGNSTPSNEDTPESDSVNGDLNADPSDLPTITMPTIISGLFRVPTLEEGPDAEIFGNHPVDTFIHSGSNMCFGILQLMVSLIPPVFSPLLKIVGFRGDRDRGIQMLWQASKFDNINGAMASLVLFGYYNGLVGFCDILPRKGAGSFPKERCKVLLTEMRKRHPNSQLWRLEEARMLAVEKQLEEAVDLMRHIPDSAMKQVKALQVFERSLDCMYMHAYEEASASFQECVNLNNWSHGLYYYIAGSAHVEVYRLLKSSDPERAKEHAVKAEKLLRIVPEHAGRKRFMARQLPFDAFVSRKVQKWEHRATEWNVDLIDAVGVSPIEEIIYFWNGYKRMRTEHLETSLKRLAWSSSDANPHWAKESLDEQAIVSLLKAATLRNMGKTAEAKKVLQTEILNRDWVEFKGYLRDSWTCPCAHYEMAANLWAEYEDLPLGEDNVELLKQCDAWLDKVSKWESYDLDTRIGLKVTTAKDTVRRCQNEKA